MRELNYTVGIDRVDPSGILFGGQQGEHNATKINVALTEDLVSALADCNNYRFEAEDGAGARRIINKGAYSNEESLSCLIPQYVTSSGGTVTVHLVFVQTDGNGEAEKICWSVAMRMRFERNISDNGYSDDEGIHDVQLLVEECKTSANAAYKSAREAKLTALEARTYSEAAEAAKENVKNLLNDAETGLASKVDKSQIVSKISYPTDIPNGGAVLALGEDLIRSNSVSSIEEQSLSDAQKEQARSNIGALSSSDLETALANYVDTGTLEGALSPLNQYSVSVLDSQEFSEAEKALGRSNIGAVSQEELSNGLEGKVDTSLITQDLASTGKDTIPTGNAVYEIVNNLIELNSVSSIEEQSLSDAQKEQARSNIGALSSSDLETALANYVDTGTLEGALSPLNQYRVSVLDLQEFSEAQKALGRSNIGAASQDALQDVLDNAVLIVPQILTTAQKGQARQNIGITIVSEITGDLQVPNGAALKKYVNKAIVETGVSSIDEQSLSDTQKERACSNIGAVKKDTYELIESIVTTEECQQVTRTAEPDGTAYAFIKCLIRVVIPATTAAATVSMNISTSGGAWLAGYYKSSATRTNGTTNYLLEAYQSDGIWKDRSDCVNTYSSATMTIKSISDANYATIGKVVVSLSTAGVNLPVGTKIEIYGVRA